MHASIRWSWVLALLLVACGPKAPLEPSQFSDPNRAPTGETLLEDGVSRAVKLLEQATGYYESMLGLVESGTATPEQLADFALLGVHLKKLPEVAQVLGDRAAQSIEDPGRAADILGLLMAHARWDLCVQVSDGLLQRKLHSGLFLVRALCLERAGRPDEVPENLLAAERTSQLLDTSDGQLLQLIRDRGAPGDIPPTTREEYESLMQRYRQLGNLERLFVQALTGWFDSDAGVTTFDPGNLTDTDMRRVLLSRARSYRYCYESLAFEGRTDRKASPLQGDGGVRLLIGPLGTVDRVEWGELGWAAHPDGGRLTQCLTQQLQMLHFPAPRYGRPTVATHFFKFVAG